MMRPSNEIEYVWLAREPQDFRKGINGLSIVVEEQLAHDPFSGHLFVFINKGRDKIKALYWERSGFCLWQKRLEKAILHNYQRRDDRQMLDSIRLLHDEFFNRHFRCPKTHRLRNFPTASTYGNGTNNNGNKEEFARSSHSDPPSSISTA